MIRAVRSRFLLLEYSVELRIEYSRAQLILEVAISYRVVQNTQLPVSSFTFLVQQRFEMSQNFARNV